VPKDDFGKNDNGTDYLQADVVDTSSEHSTEYDIVDTENTSPSDRNIYTRKRNKKTNDGKKPRCQII